MLNLDLRIGQGLQFIFRDMNVAQQNEGDEKLEVPF